MIENCTETDDLLPCPFCGGVAEYGEAPTGGAFIECTDCKHSTCLVYPLMDDVKRELRERWNRRTEHVSTPDYKALYHELLYCVGNKHPDETRHQTALRYLRNAERIDDTTGEAKQDRPYISSTPAREV